MRRYNIRMAGVGGQGVVTASHVLSNGVILSGGESTIVPFFGSEKRMAPVESYVRIAENQLYEIGEILYPNFIAIFHSQVITHGKSYTMPFYSGLKDDSAILINAHHPLPLSDDEKRELCEKRARVYYLPAMQIALKHAGTEVATNMAMLGALCAIIGVPDLASLEKAVGERFLGKGFVASGGTASLDKAMEKQFTHKFELVQKNMEAIHAAYDFAVQHGWAQAHSKESDLACIK
ncbi:MAG: NADH-dependent phenylglyoxylate dehydrogenase subunit gamma [Firmicutes bacterium]|nr:NADH-dependent phenylglyoxylate dehydrogenase subunit gamma [Bacillota bacterium]MBT9152275.1 NADH-dependent phenylglyoxylate dehydrogenase subunit gamma [Bacillota bacterium]MBT9157084.1 NADH-dependent phenylglyoxylate dehydrogenase subunit gamma [Bacillota bacterium]